MAMMGRISDIGTLIAAVNVRYVRWCRSAKRMTMPVVAIETSAMLAMVQNPDRVSSILRSSVAMILPIGMPRGAAGRVVGADARCWAMVMPLLLRALGRVGCRAGCRR